MRRSGFVCGCVLAYKGLESCINVFCMVHECATALGFVLFHKQELRCDGVLRFTRVQSQFDFVWTCTGRGSLVYVFWGWANGELYCYEARTPRVFGEHVGFLLRNNTIHHLPIPKTRKQATPAPCMSTQSQTAIAPS
jgi:hypothetical protein